MPIKGTAFLNPIEQLKSDSDKVKSEPVEIQSVPQYLDLLFDNRNELEVLSEFYCSIDVYNTSVEEPAPPAAPPGNEDNDEAPTVKNKDDGIQEVNPFNQSEQQPVDEEAEEEISTPSSTPFKNDKAKPKSKKKSKTEEAVVVNPFDNDGAEQSNPFDDETKSTSGQTDGNPFQKGKYWNNPYLGGRYSRDVLYKTYLPLTTPNIDTRCWVKILPLPINFLTPLQFAVGYGSVSSVSQLIRYNADFKIVTMNKVSLANISNERADERMQQDVKLLLQDIATAYDNAYFDFNLKQMKTDYVEEVNVPEEKKKRLRTFKDSINAVYSKTYSSIKQGKTTGEVLGEAGEAAKIKGREDALKDKPEEDESQSKNKFKEVRDGYNLGYKIGTAEKAGEADGVANVSTPRNPLYADQSTPQEVRDAYKRAFSKAKGLNVYKGFEDGITGKVKSPPSHGVKFLNFGDELSSKLQFNKIDEKVKNDYDIGFEYGLEKLRESFLKNIVDNAEQDGTLDGYNSRPMYTTKYKIKTKPLIGVFNSEKNFGDKEEVFEVDYGNLDLYAKYQVIPSIRIDPTKFPDIPMAGTDFAYGAYIQALYKRGYNEGTRNKGKGGNKTYRRKRHTKTKTYKKKLSKK